MQHYKFLPILTGVLLAKERGIRRKFAYTTKDNAPHVQKKQMKIMKDVMGPWRKNSEARDKGKESAEAREAKTTEKR